MITASHPQSTRNKLDKTGNARVNVNIEARSRNHLCRGIATIIIHSECVFVTLVIQHAGHVHRVAILMACIFLQYFST